MAFTNIAKALLKLDKILGGFIMNTTKEQRKEQAVKFMEKLGIYKPYIKGFKENDQVCFYEFYGGFWAYQMPTLNDKIKEIEKKYNCTVYAVTHEILEFGECFDFLIVSDYTEEWEDLLFTEDNIHYAFAYVWNKSDDMCSEFGTIGLKSLGGGIKRVA